MNPTMPHPTAPQPTRRWSTAKIALWATPAVFMLAMLANTRFGEGEGWSAGDFVFASVVLYGSLFAYEFVARMTAHPFYRAGVGAGVAAMAMLVWGNAAHGITITHADAWYLVVLVVAAGGMLLALFRPAGVARAHSMAHAMLAAALTMGAVSVAALLAGKLGAPRTSFEVMGITGFYVALFAASALLFWAAARDHSDAEA